jgi:hypothetical protein
MPGEAQPAALSLALGERRHGRHHLARDQPGVVGQLVDDLELIRDAIGGIDDDRYHRDVAA